MSMNCIKGGVSIILYNWCVKLIDHDPMYGRDITLRCFDKKEDAVNYAAAYKGQRKEDVFVEERRYASERNLQRDFCFDSYIVWAAWLNDKKGG